MPQEVKIIYEFGHFRLDHAERLLLKDGQPVPLYPRAFDLLLALVKSGGRVIGKSELMREVWPDSFVEESNLHVQVSAIRKALGGGQNGDKFIETVPGRGYRFVAPVKEVRVGENGRQPDTVEDAAPSATEAGGEQTVSTRPEAEIPGGNGRRYLSVAAVGLAAILVTLAAGMVLYSRSSRKTPAPDYRRVKMTRLTSSGSAFEAAISPDGKYVAYEVQNGKTYSLWLKQVGASGQVQIAPPSEVPYGGVTFSPDGGHIYYLWVEGAPKPSPDLYRMPVLGGTATKILENLGSAVSFSPDGSRLAFMRRLQEGNLTGLMVASVDGTGERTIAEGKAPIAFVVVRKPVWSPDGREIACVGAAEGKSFVFTVSVEDGAVKQLNRRGWVAVNDLVWLSDASGLLVSAQEDRSVDTIQLWHVAYPGGETWQVTNDLNSYVGLSITADSGSVVTTQSEAAMNIWVTPPGGDDSRARQLAPGRVDGKFGAAWTPDGKVIYTSEAGGNSDIWVADADGGNARQLTADSFVERSPSVSPDGRYVVFTSNRAGAEQLWRMDGDGANQRQLTASTIYRSPQFSPDGGSVVYLTWDSGRATVWKVALDGGEPERLTKPLPFTPVISPDLTLVAYTFRESQSSPLKLAVSRFGEEQRVKVFDIPQSTYVNSIAWTPDGRALTYRCSREGAINIWLQPLDGGQPKPLTNFSSNWPYGCEWSPKGDQLACVRGVLTRNVILMSDLEE